MGRPPLKKSGAMTNAERLRRHRRKVARELNLANPWLKRSRSAGPSASGRPPPRSWRCPTSNMASLRRSRMAV